MNVFLLISSLVLWVTVLFLGFLLLGALRAMGLLRWRLEQLEATSPTRLRRSGLPPGKKAPEFSLPSASGPEVMLKDYFGRQVLLVFMQPGCGPCHQITPELNRLQDAGEAQVLVIQNGTMEAVEKWMKESRPTFPVALQERFSLSKRYEVFATPFAFLIDERGVISSRGIVSTKQFLGFVLGGGGYGVKDRDGAAETFPGSQASPAAAGDLSLSYSKEVDHV